MSQTYSYEKCYKILAAEPDCSWDELRHIYKKQIQKWHPDRFEADSEKKEAADEKIKFINIAYNELSKYYKKHGELPRIETPEPEPAPQPEQSSPKAADQQPPKQPEKPKESKASASRKKHQARRSNKKKTLTTAVVFSFLFYGLFYGFSSKDIPDSSHHVNHEHDTAKPKAVKHNSNILHNQGSLELSSGIPHTNKEKQASPGSYYGQQTSTGEQGEDYFTYGSTIGEVISVQGRPTKMEKDIWYYNDSVIYFEDGKVTHWETTAETPLKAHLDIQLPIDGQYQHREPRNKPLFNYEAYETGRK